MEKTKIAIILAIVITLATLAVGVTLALNIDRNNRHGSMMGYTNYAENEDWVTHMRDHMGDSWTDMENQPWFDDMVAFMNEQLAELESQPWFDDMVAYMEESGYGNHMGAGYGGCH